ncbi:MAG: sugar porter family MFS transporter [Campylobacterales bacterium]
MFMPTSSRHYNFIVYWTAIVAALGGLLFGLDQGFIANSLSTIDKVYDLDVAQGEHYSAVLAAGGILGALSSGVIARYLGRKRSLVIAGFLFTSMTIISALIPPFEILYICRFFLGYAVGLASFVVPLYLSETAPSKIRGSMGTLFQFMITIGIFLISLTNYIMVEFISDEVSRLPLMFLVITLFASLMFIGSLFLPESPRWLMLKGKNELALITLKKIYSKKEDLDRAIKEIQEAIANSKGVFEGIKKPYFIKILLVGVGLQMFQQLVGINMMIYYAPTIFGYAEIHGFFAMMTVPVVNVLFTIPAIFLVEKWGRKKLLYFGATVMLVSLVSAGVAFSMIGGVNPMDIGAIPKGILLISAVVYIFGFAISWGPMAWLVCAEIFPLEGREVGMTVTTMVNWTFAGLVMGTALSFMQAFGNASIFFVFAGFCLLSMLFLYFFVPETKGVTLEQIEAKLKKGYKLRDIGES